MRTEARLLNALLRPVPTDQAIEDGQNVTAIIDHAREDVAELRVMLRFAVPLRKNRGGNFDVAAELFGRMAAQEKAIENCRLPLWKVEVMNDFGGNELWQRGHKEKCSLPKTFLASSRTSVLLPRS